jgi:hypothetical protein
MKTAQQLCLITGHEVGTDTRPVGRPCECANCVRTERDALRQRVTELEHPELHSFMAALLLEDQGPSLRRRIAEITIERDALRRLIEQPNPAIEAAFRAGYRADEWCVEELVALGHEDAAWAAFQAEREGRT